MESRRTRRFITAEDYLAGEQDSQVRHEYVGGEVFAMVGASDRHGLITLNLAAILSQRLPDQCQIFSSDMKVRIRADEKDIFYYPDILASCDAGDRETYYRERPCLIVEVLSPKTARLDRFEKFMFYTRLDSLEEYVLVSQDYRLLEVFRRSEQWGCTRYAEGEVSFSSLGLGVAIKDIYRRTGR